MPPILMLILSAYLGLGVVIAYDVQFVDQAKLNRFWTLVARCGVTIAWPVLVRFEDFNDDI